jgi:DNA end-binding protein Ku
LPEKNTPAKHEDASPAVRSFWSGTITFGLVSIPVDLLSAVRPRSTSMKLVDKAGHALGREYHCAKEGRKLDQDDLVRGYETSDGKVIAISDEEFASVAPEMSRDIELKGFVPLDQIPPMYFQKPYFLAPSGKSAKAYHLLAATMERTGRVGIGSFVMRDHEYLVAIIADNGVLRADTLRYADEIRTPDAVGLPKRAKGAARKADAFSKVIDDLTKRDLDLTELRDQDAQALQKIVAAKEKKNEDVIHQAGLETDDAESAPRGAKVIDLMAVLRKSLSKNAVVRNADSGPPISLAERREQKRGKTAAKAAAKPATRSASRKKASARQKTPRKPVRKKH